VTALEAGDGNVVEIAVGVRIVQRPVLAESFNVIAALDLMQHGETAPIGAGDDVAVGVEVETPGIAAALREQLKFLW